MELLWFALGLVAGVFVGAAFARRKKNDAIKFNGEVKVTIEDIKE